MIRRYTYFTSKELHLGEISLECSRAGAAAVALWATQRLLPLVPGGEFARGLERGGERRWSWTAGCAAMGDFEAPSGSPSGTGRSWTLWCGRFGADSSEASERAQKVFDACARRGLHLALVQLPGSWFGAAQAGAKNEAGT